MLALTSDNAFVWSVNPDNDSVTLIEVADDRNHKLTEVPVGDEPRCVAITPDDKKVYVTNAVSGTVSVIDARSYNVTKTIPVGTEPTGCALTLDGAKLYVANLGSDSVSVIDTHTDTVAKTITNVGAKPRAIAVAEVGGKTKVYVTQFLAQLVDDARTIDQKEGRDDGREGRVTADRRRHRHRDQDHQAGRQGHRLPVRWLDARQDRVRRQQRGHQGQHAGLPEPAREHRRARQPRLPAQHGVVAERPGQVQRQRAGLRVGDRHRRPTRKSSTRPST